MFDVVDVILRNLCTNVHVVMSKGAIRRDAV
jgi:hypothetical protein